MSMNELTGNIQPPTPVPKRPTLYALAVLADGKWGLWYGGSPREWIEGSQQALHPGSSLVIVPGEGDGDVPVIKTIKVVSASEG